jgi:DNA-binding GntR family transcriptional regulator
MVRISLKQQAYEKIKKMILANQISQEHQLTEQGLNQILKVGRGPIREALNLLSKDGLLHLVPNRGAFLRQFSPHDLIQIYQIRERLDPLAARQAIGRIDLIELDKIEKKYTSRKMASWKSDLQFSKDLHSIIYRSAGNPYLLEIFENLQLKNEVSWNSLWSLWMKVPRAKVIEKRKEEHLRIIRALKKGDAQRAENESRKHISEAMQDILEMITV